MIRVLLVSRYPLFSQGIQSLLCHHADLEILGCDSDPTRAIEHIKELRPDVVIADSHDSDWNPASVVMRILREGVTATVIGLNLEDNTLHLYHEERRMAKGVEDLVEVIRASAPQSVRDSQARVK